MRPRPFSLRHKKSLSDGTLSVEIPLVLRRRVWSLLSEANFGFGIQRDPNDRWVDNTDVLKETERSLGVLYGVREQPYRYGDPPKPEIDISSWPPERVLDFIEVFLSTSQGPSGLEGELNHTFDEESCPWRLREGTFESMQTLISEATRRDVFDMLRLNGVKWYGRLDDIEFLSRLFDLSSLPSADARDTNAEGDIRRHRFANDDWPDHWVYTDERFNLVGCKEPVLLRFLELMLDPIVRPHEGETEKLAEALNCCLSGTAYEFHRDGTRAARPVWRHRRKGGASPTSISGVRRLSQHVDREHLDALVARLSRALEQSDVDLAIGTAKELVESVSISILNQRGIAPEKDWDLYRLVSEVREVLQVAPEHVKDSKAAAGTIKKLLGNLAQVTQGIAELRNAYGTGHGRDGAVRGLQMRHARLVAGAASTLAIFLFETHLDRTSTGSATNSAPAVPKKSGDK